MGNLKNQIFGLWIIKLNKHGLGLESILRIQIKFKKSPGCCCHLKTVYPHIIIESHSHRELNPRAPRLLVNFLPKPSVLDLALIFVNKVKEFNVIPQDFYRTIIV